MSKTKIVLRNSIFSLSIGGRIFTAVDYYSGNVGGASPCETKQKVKQSIKDLKKRFKEEGKTVLIQDTRYPAKKQNYEIHIRESTEKGDFIDDNYKPGKNDFSGHSIQKIKQWLKKQQT